MCATMVARYGKMYDLSYVGVRYVLISPYY
jgi:hypothetical protein